MFRVLIREFQSDLFREIRALYSTRSRRQYHWSDCFAGFYKRSNLVNYVKLGVKPTTEFRLNVLLTL